MFATMAALALSRATGVSRTNGTATATGKQARFDWDTAALLNQKYKFDDFVIGSGINSHTLHRKRRRAPSKLITRSSFMAEWEWAKPT